MQRTHSLISALALSSLMIGGCSGGAAVGENLQAIVGGTSDPGDPAVVLLIGTPPGSQDSSLCTAEVISPHVLLTAAHCVSPQVVGAGAVFQVFLGTNVNDQSQLTNQNLMDVKSTDFDMAFNVNSLDNGHDIGVAITKNAFAITPLPVNQDPITDADVGATLRLIGFGLTSTKKADANSAGVKRQVNSTIKQVTDTLIAYGDATHNTCEGDSGGPALLQRNGKEVIAGVTSFGDQNCQLAGVDTRVDAYWDSFIKPQVIAADGTVPNGDMATGIAVSDGGTQSGTVPANGSVAVGGDCSDSAQCASGICTQGGHRYCTAACVLNPPAGSAQICPSGTHCGEVGGSPYCVVTDSGCSATTGTTGAGGRNALPAAFLLLLVSLGLYRRRSLARRRI